jgi:hypothetical protein
MKNEQFENDIKNVPSLFTKLIIEVSEGEQFLTGELDIVDSTGKLWDTYSVELKGSVKYPQTFPKLFETGDAFPKIVDWHVYEDDKSCCVDVIPNEIILCKDGLQVVDYIQRFAISYLANQSFRKREGYYLYGEYSHGIFGRIEFYQSKLKAKSPADLLKMFELIIRGYNPERTAFCPFCYKVKFRKCHRDAFRELENIKAFLYYDGLQQLIPFFTSNPDYKLPKVY